MGTMIYDDLCAKVRTSQEFKEKVNDTTLRNGTGGIMSVYISEDGYLFTAGANNNSTVRDNCLFVDDMKLIDFNKEEIL